MCLKGQCYEIFYFKFFRESAFFGPLIITFQISSKIIIHPTVRKSMVTTGMNDSSDKLFNGVNNWCHWCKHHLWSHYSKIYINRLCGSCKRTKSTAAYNKY
jgi:hypothetical protein